MAGEQAGQRHDVVTRGATTISVSGAGDDHFVAVCHEGAGAVAAATPAWEACLLARPDTLVFSRPAWARSWLSVYGRDRHPCIVEIRDRGRPAAIFPLQIATVPVLGLRRLEFIGGAAPTWAQWALNPSGLGQAIFNDGVIAPGYEAAAVGALCRWLDRQQRRWDLIQLNCLPAESPLARYFIATAGPWSLEKTAQSKQWIDLTLGWEAWLTTLSKRQRRHLRYEPHALERAGGGALELERLRGDAVTGAMEEYLELVKRRWAALGRPGMTARDAALYRALASEQDTGLIFFRLTAAGRLLSCQFGFDDGSRYLLYGLAFDPSFERQSPSEVLMQMVIKHCFDDGHREIDLGALSQVERWTQQTRSRVHLTARSLRPSARGRTAVLGGVASVMVALQQTTVGQTARRRVAQAWAQSRVAKMRQPKPPPQASATPFAPLRRPTDPARRCPAEALVSVVVPTRNSAATLAACLESLRQQTAPCSIIVVDNASTDATMTIARQLADRVLDTGPERSTQRNLGARVADTPYVGFVDSDMVVSPSVVEEALKVLQGGEGAVIVPERAFGEGFWAKVGQFEKTFYVGSDAVEAARFFRREVFEAAGGFDESFTGGEDWDLHLRALKLTTAGRTESDIYHDESSLRYLERCAKKAYYAAGLRVFVQKHGRSALTSAVLGRPYLRRPWRLVYPHPLLGAGLIAMKSGELVAVGVGFVRSLVR